MSARCDGGPARYLPQDILDDACRVMMRGLRLEEHVALVALIRRAVMGPLMAP